MTRLIVLISLLLMVFSCKNNVIDMPEKPDDLILKNKMVDIIYDMALVNAAKGINKKVLESEGVYPEDYVFKKHSIDSLQFALSSEYYAYNLKVYEDIYNRVRVRLNKDKRHYNTLIEAAQKQRDSISRSKREELDSLKKNRKSLNKKLKKVESTEEQGLLQKTDTSQTQIDL